jgi:hypothetical protein
MKSILFIFLTAILFMACSYPQIKVNWDTDSHNLWYRVYYCAGDDSALFPIKNGVTHDQVWDWQTGSTLYPYFYVKNDGYGKYFRVGIIGESSTGDLSKMTVKTYERKKAIIPNNLTIMEVKE